LRIIYARFFILICFLSATSNAESFLDRAEIRAYFDELSQSNGFSKKYLEEIFSNHKPNLKILELMSRPAEKRLEWHEYRKILVDERRVSLGLRFWEDNLKALEDAERVFGVSPEVIVAIIGVETRYGKIMGSFLVVQALATLAFDFPSRADFFRKELTNYLILTRSQNLDPLSLKGSYAGAMGYGQFMPSSYQAYAVDFDGDGFKDIWNNKADAIGSVANYFSEHGWQGDGPVIVRGYKQIGSETSIKANVSLKPSILAGELKKEGIDSSLADSTEVALFLMQADGGEEYWLGLNDFYVITRYNHSSMYALAVYQLSQELREKRLELLK